MEKKQCRLISFLLMMAFVFFTFLTPSAVQAAAQKVVSITMVKSGIKVNEGKSQHLNIKTNTISSISYKSSDTKIAVAKNGKIYAYSPGKVKITVTATPKSRYYKKTTKSIYVNVIPVKPKSLTAIRRNGQIMVTAAQVKSATGYQFIYATNSKFLYKTTAFKKSNSYIFSASDKTTYYIKVRAYTLVKNKKYYSEWSSVFKAVVPVLIVTPTPTATPTPSPTPVICTIHFDSQGGTPVEDIKAERYSLIDLPEVTRDGYKFNGWMDDPYGGSYMLSPMQVNSDVTLYALWERIPDPASYVNEVISLVNQERSKIGLSPLNYDPQVTQAAMNRAKELEQLFSHDRPNGTDCFTALDEMGIWYYAAGENIAAGQSTPEHVMYSWMNSPGHRANILGNYFTNIGVGFYQNISTGVTYWVQLFIG